MTQQQILKIKQNLIEKYTNNTKPLDVGYGNAYEKALEDFAAALIQEVKN